MVRFVSRFKRYNSDRWVKAEDTGMVHPVSKEGIQAITILDEDGKIKFFYVTNFDNKSVKGQVSWWTVDRELVLRLKDEKLRGKK